MTTGYRSLLGFWLGGFGNYVAPPTIVTQAGMVRMYANGARAGMLFSLSAAAPHAGLYTSNCAKTILAGGQYPNYGMSPLTAMSNTTYAKPVICSNAARTYAQITPTGYVTG